MVDVKPNVHKALNAIRGVKAFYFYPDTFNGLPCVSYYEANNAPDTFADDIEYSSKIVYVVDVWGETSTQVTKTAQKAEGKMLALGFVREFARDVHDPASAVRHKTMRFKLITGDDDVGRKR